MGLLVDGVWRDEWYDTKTSGGRFERERAKFHDRIDTVGRFAPEAGRYRLYVSWACPWVHRTLILHRPNVVRSEAVRFTRSTRAAGASLMASRSMSTRRPWKPP